MTMMMWTITKYLIFIGVAMGVVGSMQLFNDIYYTPPQNDFTNYTVEDSGAISQIPTAPGIGDYFGAFVMYFVGAVLLLASVVMCVVCIFPYLVWVFGVPVYLAVALQTGIYIQYAMGWAQWKSKQSAKVLE